jgi:phosphomannomutase
MPGDLHGAQCDLLSAGALEGLKVGVYQHSTVARDLLVDLLKQFGAEVIAFARSETFIPVDTEAVSEDTIAFEAGVERPWS